MDSSDSGNVDWPPSPVIARLANFLEFESSSDSDSDVFSLPNSWGGMTPYEANILAIASKSRSPKVAPHSRPPKEQTSLKAQQQGSKSPYSKSDEAHKKLSNTLKRKHVSMSQPTTESESSKAKRSSAQKAPRNGSSTKPMKSPKRKSQDVRRSQSTLSPYLRKMASCHVSVPPNTCHEARVVTSPSGRSSSNKMTTCRDVRPLQDHQEAVNHSSSTASSRVSMSPNTPSHKKHIATSPSRISSENKMNVQPLQDRREAVNRSSTKAVEEAAHYQTPQLQEKFCDGLTIPRRKLFSECHGMENRAPRDNGFFKKHHFQFDYLPDLDECDFPAEKSYTGSAKQNKVAQKSDFNTKNPSDLDSALLNKADPTADEAVKQSRNLPKLTEEQYVILRATFSANPYPSLAEVAQIAADIGVSALKLKTYFNGRRSTLRQRMKKRGFPFPSKEEICFFAVESRMPDWGELLFKPDEAEDENYQFGHEANGGKYLNILCDIGLDFVKSY